MCAREAVGARLERSDGAKMLSDPGGSGGQLSDGDTSVSAKVGAGR